MIIQKAFLSWCDHHGIQSPGLQIRGWDTPNRYMASLTNVELTPQDNIVQVPLEACVTAESTRALAEKLAFERGLGAKSDYAPHLDVLPTLESPALACLPRFWKPDDPRLEFIDRADCGQLQRRLEEDEDLSEGLDPWAMAMVDSRSNFLPDERYSITPVLDMFNHSPTQKTKGEVTDEKVLQLQCSNLPSQPDEEVFISYGDYSNLDTLCQYGFITPDNPWNMEEMEVRLGGSPKEETIFISSDFGIPTTLLTRLFLEYRNYFIEGGRNEIVAVLDNQLVRECMKASRAAEEARAKDGDDDLVGLYLEERAKTLGRAHYILQQQFPEAFEL